MATRQLHKSRFYPNRWYEEDKTLITTEVSLFTLTSNFKTHALHQFDDFCALQEYDQCVQHVLSLLPTHSFLKPV
jgi:hypothetical protein